MSASKRKGTAAETAVLRVLQARGVPCHRVALAGIHDRGDVLTDDRRLVLEVKGGASAGNLGEAKLAGWMHETAVERVNSGAEVAVLVTKVPGKGDANAHLWRAHLDAHAHGVLTGGSVPEGVVVSMTLEDMVHLWQAHTAQRHRVQ